MPAELHAGLADCAAQQPDLALQLVDTVLTEPLERCVRLGHESADRRRAAGLLRVLATDLDDVARQLGDPARVFVHLGRHAGEEVQLHAPPALRVRAVDRGVQVVLGDELVEDLPDPPRAAFGRERQPRPADLLDLARDADGERVDAQRRQRQAHAPGARRQVSGRAATSGSADHGLHRNGAPDADARAPAEAIPGQSISRLWRGVREVIENFTADFELTMALAGCRTVAEIDREALVPAESLGSVAPTSA